MIRFGTDIGITTLENTFLKTNTTDKICQWYFSLIVCHTTAF